MSMKVWVLGFDGGCAKCTKLAQQIQQLSNQKLSLVSLRSFEAQIWRTKAMSENSPLVPTLFKVEGEKVKSYTAIKMAVQILRLLGPLKTWQILSLLGEASFSPESTTISGRRRFVRTMAGGSAAISLLSFGKTSFTRAAAASVYVPKINAIKLANESTSKQILANAESNPQFLQLRSYLEQKQFVSSNNPDVRIIELEGLPSASVFVQEYVNPDKSRKASLIFAIKADGTTGTCILMSPQGAAPQTQMPYSLYVNSAGEIQTFTYTQLERLKEKTLVAQASIEPLCSICTVICGSSTAFCPLGAVLGCALVCDLLPLVFPECEAACVPVFAVICAGCRINVCRCFCF